MPETIVMKEIKISKLFHLLYATLLLAPVFAVGVTCAQTAFTGNGFVAEPQNVYIENTSAAGNDIKADTWYICDTTKASLNWGDITFKLCDFVLWEDSINQKPIYIRNIDTVYFNFSSDFNSMIVGLESWNPSINTTFVFDGMPLVAFRYKDTKEITSGNFNLPLKADTTLFDKAIPIIGEEKGYQDVFYTSVDKVGQSPFFNWAEKSFIGEGFRYMGNIFGMPTDNPFYTFTCYWCAISILWLIFDVVMYVPKLAHRWLDKGAIE